MTPALAAIAPPGDPQAAVFVAGIFVGALGLVGLCALADWFLNRVTQPVCLACGQGRVEVCGDFCSRCTGRSPRRAGRGVVHAPDRRWRP